MTTGIELKPCPFCGTAAVLEQVGSIDEDDVATWQIRCPFARCTGGNPASWDQSQAQVIIEWNTRTPDHAATVARLEAENARLREAIRNVLEQFPKQPFEDGRCQICGWPLAASVAEGCTADGNCSYRPNDRSAEWSGLRFRRALFEARAALASEPQEGKR